MTQTTAAPSQITQLHQAKRGKNDEFYTRLEDVEAELRHYRKHFKDKTVYLNCDDPRWSAFWKYFALNFQRLGLKRLISTHYTGFSAPGESSYMLEILRGRDEDPETGMIDELSGVKTELIGDGDFRSEESITLLEQSDIVVTNPPFSLFREYVAQLMEHDKKFLIIGNMNAVTYKDFWPYVQENKVWLGPSIRSGDRPFRVPESYPLKAAGCWIDDDGNRWIRVTGVRWFTNLDHKFRHEEVVLWKTYTGNESEYPKYDNYDAIEVSKVVNIPADYEGTMGVPITFLGKHNPDQFEIVGQSRMVANPIEIDGKPVKDLVYHDASGNLKYPYMRVMIRNKALQSQGSAA